MKVPGLNYSSPISFTLKQRLLLTIIPPAVYFALWIVMRWSRPFEVRHPEYLDGLIQEKGHAILGIWHEIGMFALWRHRGRNFHTTTSYSFDGEIAARTLHRFGCEAVRGSSSRGGSQALKEMEKATRLVPTVGLSLDGPRGPRRISKPGAAILSGRTGNDIVPVAFAVTPAWRLRSWDRMPIPKPFARVICAYGPPIPAALDDSPEAVEVCRKALEEALNALHREIEAEIGDSTAME
ncbi:MAG: lysophospholipid acyltransferase family protein [Candidatus Hydrogenedentes bacterium]|nr:lysophospholipid acyltransferase family protein [Candidatus Hydrogenedentota bacterium]